MEKNNVLVSVVIPTHNRANLLVRAIKSVQNQTITNIEIIVVSDGFDEKTDKIMCEISKHDKRINYIVYNPGKGGNYARNIGIKKSKGIFVAFLDDDDVWYERKLEKQLNLANKDKNIGLVCTGINAIYEGEKNAVLFIPPAKYDAGKQILIDNCIGSTTTVMVKKSLFTTSGLFDENLQAQQDYDMWIRLCQITKIGVVREACVDYYNYRDTNQISQSTKKYEKAVAYIEKKYTKEYKKLNKNENDIRKANQLLNIAKKALRNENSKVGRYYIRLAIKQHLSTHALECYLGSYIKPETSRSIRSALRKFRYFFCKFSDHFSAE